MNAHHDSISALAFTPDGRHLISGSFDRKVKVWDLPTGDGVATYETFPAQVISVVYLQGDLLGILTGQNTFHLHRFEVI